MNCESDITIGTGFLKAEQFMGPDSEMPTIEVYIAGSFPGTPIILTKALHLGFHKEQMRKGMQIPNQNTRQLKAKTMPLPGFLYRYTLISSWISRKTMCFAFRMFSSILFF